MRLSVYFEKFTEWDDIKENFLNHDIDLNPKVPGHILENTFDLVKKKKILLFN